MWFEIGDQGSSQGQIDIGSEVVNWVVRDIEICRRLQRVRVNRLISLRTKLMQRVLLLDPIGSRGVNFHPGDRHS